MAEFGTEEPLWLGSSGGTAAGGVPLDQLPLSDGLKQRLRAWARLHDELNDPPFSSGTHEELQAFASLGRALLLDVRGELGATYDVQDPLGT